MNKVVLSLVALVLAGVPARGQEYPDISIRFGHTFPPTVGFSRIDQWFAEEMERRSGGRIKIKIFWSEALGKNTEMLDLIGAGAIEMGSIVPSFFPTPDSTSRDHQRASARVQFGAAGADHSQRDGTEYPRDPGRVSAQQRVADLQSRHHRVPHPMHEAGCRDRRLQKSSRAQLWRSTCRGCGRHWELSGLQRFLQSSTRDCNEANSTAHTFRTICISN